MSGMFNFHTREAVRVKVKKCEGLLQPEYRKFSVDPEITSFEVLQSLLARAFDIKGEFTTSYLAKDDAGHENYFSLLSDWDLDAAFLSASVPCLRLKVDLKPFEEGLEDWDIIAPADFPLGQGQQTKDKSTIAGTILNQMERMVQKALNFVDNQQLSQQQIKPIKAPMNDFEFHNYLDSDGRLVRPTDLRLNIYQGGLEQGLRKVVWKHILNVYPEGLSGAERVDYMKRLSKEYHRLRATWHDAPARGVAADELHAVTNMVRKDVLRTDRTHKFYAGADDNKNIISLFNILTTFALNHPSVSYCQGMSDLASPLLVTMRDEAHAYVCFCALMKRLRPNFLLDGQAMTAKFQHLTEALQIYDPIFFDYLQKQGADDLLFCYRWLLLELKREFAFDDALRMLEVLWSSMPPCPPDVELELFEVEFDPRRVSTTSTASSSCSSASHLAKKVAPTKENPYTKVRAMRRQSSSSSGGSLRCGTNSKSPANNGPSSLPPLHLDLSGHAVALATPKTELTTICQSPDGAPDVPLATRPSSTRSLEADAPNEILPDYLPLSTPISRELRMNLEELNRQIPGRHQQLFGGVGRTSGGDSEELESPGAQQQNRRLATTEEDDYDNRSGPSTTASSSDSDEASTGERIRRIRPNGSRRQRQKMEALCHQRDGVAVDRSEGLETSIKTSDDSDDDCSFHLNGEIFENEDEDDVVFDASAPDLVGRYKNPHLRKVVPIHLVPVVRAHSPRRRHQQQQRHIKKKLGGATTTRPNDEDSSSTTTSSASTDSEDNCGADGETFGRHVSEGYATTDEVAASSSGEVLPGGVTRSTLSNATAVRRRDDGRFVDSGVSADNSSATPLMTNSCEEALESGAASGASGAGSFVSLSRAMSPPLPPPTELGGGNPFMIFLCVTLLIQHRDYVIKCRMDYNEMAMHFDKMVRRHNVLRVLGQARTLFGEYMRQRRWATAPSSGEVSSAENSLEIRSEGAVFKDVDVTSSCGTSQIYA